MQCVVCVVFLVFVVSIFLAFLSTRNQHVGGDTIQVMGLQVGLKSDMNSFLGPGFYFFLGYCSEEFECDLSGAPGENTDWGWFDMETLPSPLFPTLKATLLRIF